MVRTNPSRLKVLVVIATMVVSFAAALPAQAKPRETLLQTTAMAKQLDANSWEVTAKVTNVGRMPALPSVSVDLVLRDANGSENVVSQHRWNGALPRHKSFTHTFVVETDDPAEVFAVAQARNAPSASSEPIPVPIPPVLALGLAGMFAFITWRKRARRAIVGALPTVGV